VRKARAIMRPYENGNFRSYRELGPIALFVEQLENVLRERFGMPNKAPETV